MSFGTIRSNRKSMPKDLQTVPLSSGDVAFRRRGQLVALRWQDKKILNLLTTVHNPIATMSVTTGTFTKTKPVAIQDCILNMAECIIQSHILHSKYLLSRGEKPLRLKISVKKLGTDLSEIFFHRSTEQPDGRNNAAATADKTDKCLYERHFPDWIPSTAKKVRPTGSCRRARELQQKNQKTTTGRGRRYLTGADGAMSRCV
ncbi:hypothetical protein RRG08_013663 [Elysia crispata]|uniref:PiggyBac transposable element-derived protein domain-containing protein n=1 Tax=Elysia crispata TaxID=231223 RepID=A0AAE1A1S5_9GAST|nr:hypothetical protein RRG08_013663 [Elysia crispata]